MTAFVLDASVAAKWFLPANDEPLKEEALRLLEDYAQGRLRFLVPDLFWPELGSILWKCVRLERISRQSAERALAMMQDRGIKSAPNLPLLKDAFAIAAAFGSSVYDGTYVALAVISNAPMITADQRLCNALGTRYPVRWLGAL